MEEKKVKKAEVAKKEAPAITPEMGAQMQAMLQQANERIQQIVNQARQMEQMLRDKTIDHMFNVIKYAHEFNPDFVGKCADAITAYISNIAFQEETENVTDAPVEDSPAPEIHPLKEVTE